MCYWGRGWKKELGVQGEVGRGDSGQTALITVTPFYPLCPHRASPSRVSMGL